MVEGRPFIGYGVEVVHVVGREWGREVGWVLSQVIGG